MSEDMPEQFHTLNVIRLIARPFTKPPRTQDMTIHVTLKRGWLCSNGMTNHPPCRSIEDARRELGRG